MQSNSNTEALTKRCIKCQVEKVKGEFYRKKGSKDGLMGWCKGCSAEQKREYYKANKEAISEQKREYYKANKEAYAEQKRKYREANKEAISEQDRKYYKANKEAIAERQRESRKKRLATDPKYAMIVRIRRLMQKAIRAKGMRKSQATLKAIDCTAEYFHRHIELQFTKGMTWENREKWHLDHIIPISTAENEADVYALSHYLNIRPLWADENLSKSNEIKHLI